MKKNTDTRQKTGKHHPILSFIVFTILYFILTYASLFVLTCLTDMSGNKVFVFVCLASALYLILVAVRIVRRKLARERMERRLSNPERRARLREMRAERESAEPTTFRKADADHEIETDHKLAEPTTFHEVETGRKLAEPITFQETENMIEQATFCKVNTDHEITHAVPSVSAVKRRNRKRLLLPAICSLAIVCGLALYFNWNSNRIPKDLLELKAKYPETASFVDNYPQNKNKKHSIDLSGEVQPGSIPLFLQWDERWGYETYGSNFLALTGCGPTCISMIVCGLTGDTSWNPYETAKFSEQQGYYVPGEGTSWNLMTEGAQMLGLNAAYGDVSADYIYSYLDSIHPIICSMYPGDFTTSGHFIVLTGIDSDGNLIVNDPNSRIKSETRWQMDTVLPQIRSLWSYSL